MILGMVAGALILVIGFIGGYQAAVHFRKQPKGAYDKYKNIDGLYSRKVVRQKAGE